MLSSSSRVLLRRGNLFSMPSLRHRHTSLFDAHYLEKNKANYTPLSPLSLLKKTVQHYPNVLCYVHGNIQRTWKEVDQRIKRLASALEVSLHVKKNDVVSIIAPNVISIFEANFAVPSTGAVLHSINTRSDPETIAFQLNHAKTKVLIVDTEFSPVIRVALDLVAQMDKSLAHDMIIVEVYDDPAYGKCNDGMNNITNIFAQTNRTLEYEAFLRSAEDSFQTYQLQLPSDEWDAISLNYTSGTTGNPKGVVCHHRGAYLNSLANVVEWNWSLFPRFLWIVPMFHCNGWMFPYSLCAMAGTSYFLRHVRPETMFDLIERYEIQYFAGAPVTMNTMLAYPHRKKFSHKMECWVAGAPPPPAVIKRFESEIGIMVRPAYGLTETYGPICTHAVDQDWLHTSNSHCNTSSSNNSTPITDEELLLKRTYLSCDTMVEDLQVLDPDTLLAVPSDGKTLGEVMVRGNIVMKGYLANEKATNDTFKGGWFHTGDLAVHHGNGRIELKDRSKDIIISGGENVSSIQVENRLLMHEWIGESAVIAKEDEKWGEIPVAFLVARPGSSAVIVSTKQELGKIYGENREESCGKELGGGTPTAATSLATTATTPTAAAITETTTIAKFGNALQIGDTVLTSSDMIAWARTKMAGYETPKHIVFIEALPKTSTGKTQKHVLRKMLPIYTATATTPTTTSTTTTQ